MVFPLDAAYVFAPTLRGAGMPLGCGAQSFRRRDGLSCHPWQNLPELARGRTRSGGHFQREGSAALRGKTTREDSIAVALARPRKIAPLRPRPEDMASAYRRRPRGLRRVVSLFGQARADVPTEKGTDCFRVKVLCLTIFVVSLHDIMVLMVDGYHVRCLER